MEDSDEIKQLLREIRDLLKANYDESTEFRNAALARQHASDARIKASREDDRRFRDQIVRDAQQQQAAIEKLVGGPWGFVARMAVAIGLVVCAAIIILREFGLLGR
jgi:ElaB/YqjD/DUF883 family membrane-anchored ribosome-binding protein